MTGCRDLTPKVREGAALPRRLHTVETVAREAFRTNIVNRVVIEAVSMRRGANFLKKRQRLLRNRDRCRNPIVTKL